MSSSKNDQRNLQTSDSHSKRSSLSTTPGQQRRTSKANREKTPRALGSRYPIPKDLSRNFNEWFYGDMSDLRPPGNGPSNENRQPSVDLGSRITEANLKLSDNLEFMTQNLGVHEHIGETLALSLFKTYRVSLEENPGANEKEDEKVLDLTMSSSTVLIDRRTALTGGKKNTTNAERAQPDTTESPIAAGEDCDESLEGEERNKTTGV